MVLLVPFCCGFLSVLGIEEFQNFRIDVLEDWRVIYSSILLGKMAHPSHARSPACCPSTASLHDVRNPSISTLSDSFQ